MCSTARSSSRAAQASSGSARTTSRRAGRASTGRSFHERGVARLRAPAGGLVAAHDRVTRREKENGVVVALDVQTGKHQTIYGMGRHNHENNVAIPGFDDLVVLSGDDTFTSGPLTGVPAPPTGTRHCRPGTSSVAALLLHRAGHGLAAERRGRPLGLRLRHGRREELLRRCSGLDSAGDGPLHQGAQGHRHRARHRRLGAESGRPRLPVAAYERHLATRPSLRRLRSASTARSGCSSTGATSTTCSSSSASRTSPTTRTGRQCRLHRRLGARTASD